MNKCYTVGHSNLTISDFIDLLGKHDINVIADVRSMPFSQYVPHFNKDVLPKHLNNKGIKYVHLGDLLGGQSSDPNLFFDNSSQISYKKIANTDYFKQGIKRIEEGIRKDFKIAIMCSEKSPLDCHRFCLVSNELLKININVDHIVYYDSIDKSETKPHQIVESEMKNLYSKNDKNQKTLDGFEVPVDSIYEWLNKKIAYKEKGGESSD